MYSILLTGIYIGHHLFQSGPIFVTLEVPWIEQNTVLTLSIVSRCYVSPAVGCYGSGAVHHLRAYLGMEGGALYIQAQFSVHGTQDRQFGRWMARLQVYPHLKCETGGKYNSQNFVR